DGPGGAVPAAAPAMQVVRRIVGFQMVGHAAQREARVADPIRYAAADGAQEMVLARVAGRVVEPEDDVAEAPLAIGDPQLDDRRTEGRDRRRGAARVDQGVKLAHCAEISAPSGGPGRGA